jgi:molybdopterin-guanine dinucleotide biosynthesis protein A
MEQPGLRSDFTAAILAGGSNTRFSGRTKANIVIDGKPIIERTINILQGIFDDLIIITNKPDEFSKYNHVRLAGDIYPGVGPLGGLHSALVNTHSNAVFLVASDMPALNADMIMHIKSSFLSMDCEALIPGYNGYIEPLHAIYKRDILERLDNFIRASSDYSVREFLRLVDDKYILIDNISLRDNPFLNINTPEDLQKWF